MLGRRSHSRIDEDENIYYNINFRVPNEDGQGALPAVVSDDRVQAVLENPREYEMAVVRFNVPAFTIPIMFLSHITHSVTSFNRSCSKVTQAL